MAIQITRTAKILLSQQFPWFLMADSIPNPQAQLPRRRSQILPILFVFELGFFCLGFFHVS